MEKHYDINKNLRNIGQYTCLVEMAGSLAGEIIGVTTATIGLIKDDDKLLFTGFLIAGLSYTCFIMADRIDSFMNKSKNKPNKLEQNLLN